MSVVNQSSALIGPDLVNTFLSSLIRVTFVFGCYGLSYTDS